MRPQLLALTLIFAAPAFAQNAPANWKTQARDNGATTFTPPDLRAGEIYSVTVYDVAALDGKSLEDYLRDFGGTVGAQTGQLKAPLKVQTRENRVVSGNGIYNGPDQTQLAALFIGVTNDDGQTVRIARTFASSEALLKRYQTQNGAIVGEMVSGGAGAQQQPRRPVGDEPQEVADVIVVGGPIKAGVYVGLQRSKGLFGASSQRPLRVYLYANGEYRVTDNHDEDFDFGGPLAGKYKYNAARGTLDLGGVFDLKNDNVTPDRDFCYYGVDKDGTPTILARGGISPTSTTYLTWSGPPTKRLSPSAQNAPALAKQKALDAIPTVVVPGKGVASAQIAAIVHDYSSSFMTMPGAYVGETFGGFSPDISMNKVTDDVYLLLRDGTVYRGLQTAPDQFDVAASKRREPENWGLWKTENGKTQVSFGGKSYEKLDGKKVSPAAPNTKFAGRCIPGDADAKGAISFTAAGRFTRASRAENEIILTKSNKDSGGLAGTYTLDGTAMTLRYDSGKVTRTLFFFGDKSRDTIWFEGQLMVLDR